MMRSAMTLLLLLASAVMMIAVASSASWSGGPTPERQAQLRNLVLQDCGSCHGMTMKGGLGSPLLPESLADLDAEAVSQIVLDGVPGTPMPPWRGLLTQSEADWIATALKAGVIK
jgi:cytochrome c55X